MNILLFGAIALALASGDAEIALETSRPYHGVARPVRVTFHAPEADRAELALMDANGGLLAPAVAVRTGEVDLAQLLPDVWRLRRAAYLQLVVEDEPVGSSLVVEPLLSRLVPVTEVALNPRGVRYTRIVRWHDELRGDGDPDAPEGPGDDRPWLAGPGDEGRLLSGLRLYPERDVVLRTSHGDIRVALRPDEAPNTAWNFRTLCRDGFYRDVVFHRVAALTPAGDPFVIQGGDPTATGSGGPGYWLPMERSGLAHDFGVISMARDVDPDSAGSQFFFCLSRAGTARLDGHYCAFGQTVAGRDTILAIAAVELADVASGRPADPPVVVAAELVSAPPRRPGAGRPDRPVVRELPVEPPAERRPRAERVPR